MARRIAVAWAAEDREAALQARSRAAAVIAVRTRPRGCWRRRRPCGTGSRRRSEGSTPSAACTPGGRGGAFG